MKFIHRCDKKIIILYAVLFLLICTAVFIPEISQAAEFSLFPGEKESIGDYRKFIQNFYRFSIAAGILIATVMIMIGGVIWITSAGDQGRVGKAKVYMTDSIIGVVLLLSAYLILAVINPSLVELKKPGADILQAPSAAEDEEGEGACDLRGDPRALQDCIMTENKEKCEGGKGEAGYGGKFHANITCADLPSTDTYTGEQLESSDVDCPPNRVMTTVKSSANQQLHECNTYCDPDTSKPISERCKGSVTDSRRTPDNKYNFNCACHPN